LLMIAQFYKGNVKQAKSKRKGLLKSIYLPLESVIRIINKFRFTAYIHIRKLVEHNLKTPWV